METSVEENEHPSATAETHFVEPHYVEGYEREDGIYVEGYWRDGDGDTTEDRSLEDGGGYEQTNPDDDLTNNLD
jgi:hypothetical protein